MKTKLFAALVLAVTLSGCTDNDYEQRYYVTGISKITTTDNTTNHVTVQDISYTDATGKVLTSNSYQGYVRVLSQVIQGAKVSKIDYRYNPDRTLVVTTTSAGGINKDSLLLDKYMMVDSVYSFADAKWVDDTLQINAQGYREMEGRYALTVDRNGNYTSATRDDKPYCRYLYNNTPRNYMGLQQFPILGSEYNWLTDNFGYASRYLLSDAVVIENGDETLYTYSYYLNHEGYVVLETIKRNHEPYRTILYEYATYIKVD